MDAIKNNISGIYKITNKISGKIYNVSRSSIKRIIYCQTYKEINYEENE